ncbi:hypothetical protein GCM10022233_32650 [Streptomyces shaanxiensis]|uniref:Uncharacterized protein n=1 Tax=Streptomyces shaanxiensis TaxID=653357 RepID=A0ABP7V2H6_9ACTN
MYQGADRALIEVKGNGGTHHNGGTTGYGGTHHHGGSRESTGDSGRPTAVTGAAADRSELILGA